MALKCISPAGFERSFLYDKEGWDLLTTLNRETYHLKMPCCNAPVVLKTSKLGTFFFAHKSRAGCTTAPESKEHLLAKDTIARAAMAVAWQVDTEVRGGADESTWIADVLCARSDKQTKVAFEVQWSRQTIAITHERQNAYRNSKVRALWLFKQLDFPVSKDVPAFRLVFLPDGSGFEVLLPSSNYASLLQIRSLRGDQDWGQRIELSSFVRGALNGALKFAPLQNAVVPIVIELSFTDCWSCKKEIRLVTNFVIKANQVFPGFGEFSFGLTELEEMPDWESWVNKYLKPERIEPFNVGPVKMRSSRMAGASYLSNGCIHCGALQGRFFEHEAFDLEPVVMDAELLLTPEFIQRSLGHEGSERWWFDISLCAEADDN